MRVLGVKKKNIILKNDGSNNSDNNNYRNVTISPHLPNTNTRI